MCCLCHAIHNLSTGRSDSCVRLPSSGQDVVYYCLLCTSPPYPATSTTAVGAEYHIQYHSGYLDILMQKDFLFGLLSREKNLVCIGDTQLIDTSPGPQIS